MTKKENYAVLETIVNASDYENKAELIDFINHEVEMLSRKSSKTGETKTQKENKAIMDVVEDALGSMENAVTVSELQAADDRMAQYSNQKLTWLLKQMVEAGRVVKTVDKKKSYFSLAVEG